MTDAAARAAELREQLAHHGHRYYVLDDPEIGDDAYDALLDELRGIEAEHPELLTPDSPTQKVGAEPVSRLEKVTHPQAMLSLANAREMDFRLGSRFAFERAADFVARVVAELDDVPLPEGTLLNINVPAGEPEGVQVTRLGKRIYRDELKLDAEDEDGGRRYWIYGADPGFHDDEGTDLAAVHARHIAVTPVHFDLTDLSGLDALAKYDLARLLAPAAREVQ